VTFTGFLEGETLAHGLASADVKVFPSTTDTWGNAPLEAQAAGLPVIVSDVGGPVELMQHGVTGFSVPGRNAQAFSAAMEALMDAPLRAQMGRSARQFAEEHNVHEPFMAVFNSDEHRRRLELKKRAAKDVAPFELVDLMEGQA
jgi:glycosyltransferase involved in cell wall biosynthesis